MRSWTYRVWYSVWNMASVRQNFYVMLHYVGPALPTVVLCMAHGLLVSTPRPSGTRLGE